MAISVAIIGAGKLGLALAQELNNSGLLQFVLTHNDQNRKLTKFPQEKIMTLDEFRNIDNLPDVIFLTVQDNKIEDLSRDISEYFGDKLAGTIVAHCSGSLGVDVLSSASKYAKSVAKIHPYQTFYYQSNNVFDGVAWAIDCDVESKPILEKLIHSLSGKAVFTDSINNFNDELYHISAVFSANYQSANIAFGSRVAKLSGIEPKNFIPKIAITTIENAMQSLELDDDKFALTGPISRGDLLTVNKHIAALRPNEVELKGYLLMGLATAEIAFSEDIITADDFNKLKKILLDEIKYLYLT